MEEPALLAVVCLESMASTPLQAPASASEQGELTTAKVAPGRLPSAEEVMGKSRLENFRVANPVLPRALRADLYALYGFARLVDDVGDEAEGDRLALLNWLDGELDALYAGRPEHELMQRLLPTVRAHAIPPDPFRRLIEANRRDQKITRYRTFDELLGYCRLSADPVGHLVLYVFDRATPERMDLSDRVCSGLQIVEHLQDVAEDLERGRVYLPMEDMERHGCTVEDLATRPTPVGVRQVVAFEALRARRLLDDGAPLARTLPWRAGLAVSGFVAGGRAALGAIERRDYDVLAGPPRASQARRLAAFLTILLRLART
jgi:squalene synthase HpnC